MNNQTPTFIETPTQITQVNQTQNQVLNRWLFSLLLIGLFITSSFLGLIASTVSKPTLQEKTIPPPNLPVSTLILPPALTQNSVLSDWFAQIDGQVTAKTKVSFLISKATIGYNFQGTLNIEQTRKDQELEVIYVPDRTVFEKEGQAETVKLDLNNLTVGSIVSGSVKFEKVSEGWKAVGQHFLIRNLDEQR